MATAATKPAQRARAKAAARDRYVAGEIDEEELEAEVERELRPQRQKRRRGKTTAAAWKERALHDVTLPSGAEVTIRIPDLALLLKGGAVPNGLRAAAMLQVIREATGEAPQLVTHTETGDRQIDEETLGGLVNLQEWLVLQSVVEPQLEVDDLPDVPYEDRVMLMEIASRERDTDALGVRLGVEPLDRWEPFREAHRCPAKCPSCEEARAALSTRHVGRL